VDAGARAPASASERAAASERAVSCLEAKSGYGDWSLPGRGEPYSDCGQKRYRGCLNVAEHPAGLNGRPPGMAYLEIYPRSCFRAQCPTCYEDWINREVRRVEHRMKKIKRSIHLIVSAPRGDWDLSYEKLRSRAYKIAKMSGLKGGCSVFHPWRDGGDLGPHFHMLGPGWIDHVREIYRETGWVVKNKGLRKNLGKTLRYELGHAGIHKEIHTITWFGDLAYCKFKAPPLEEDLHVCPLCGQELVKLMWYGELGAPEPPQEIGFEGYVDPNGWFEQGGGW